MVCRCTSRLATRFDFVTSLLSRGMSQLPRPVEAVRMEVIPSSVRWAAVMPPESRFCELVRKICLSRHGNYHAGVALVLVYRGVLQHVSHM